MRIKSCDVITNRDCQVTVGGWSDYKTECIIREIQLFLQNWICIGRQWHRHSYTYHIILCVQSKDVKCSIVYVECRSCNDDQLKGFIKYQLSLLYLLIYCLFCHQIPDAINLLQRVTCLHDVSKVHCIVKKLQRQPCFFPVAVTHIIVHVLCLLKCKNFKSWQ